MNSLFDPPVRLTKRLFTGALGCAKAAYLDAHKLEKAAELPIGVKARMQAGTRIGILARGLFPSGVLVEPTPGEFDGASVTKRFISAGVDVLFEAQLETELFLVKTDILVRRPGGWEIIEVKSSTKVKPEHIADLAFQVYVARKSGLTIVGASIAVVDTSFVFEGDGYPASRLMKVSDETASVEEMLPRVEADSRRFFDMLSGSSVPLVETNRHCPGCGYYDACHVDQPEDDLVFMPKLRATDVSKLRAQGYRRISELPADAKLNEQQRRVWQVLNEGKPYIGPSLPSLLDLKFPIHFIDFEAFSSVTPEYIGIHPYQVLPFQWSNHIWESPETEPRHEEFLHLQKSDPRAAFASTLYASLQGAATIVVYSPYEGTQLRNLTALEVPYASELDALLAEWGVDLLQVVRDNTYFAGYKGSYSIKTVLPTLVPSCNYSDLAIQDGQAAAVEYQRMLDAPSADASLIAENLMAYCKRDTLAMVRIFQRLKEICQG